MFASPLRAAPSISWTALGGGVDACTIVRVRTAQPDGGGRATASAAVTPAGGASSTAVATVASAAAIREVEPGSLRDAGLCAGWDADPVLDSAVLLMERDGDLLAVSVRTGVARVVLPEPAMSAYVSWTSAASRPQRFGVYASVTTADAPWPPPPTAAAARLAIGAPNGLFWIAAAANTASPTAAQPTVWPQKQAIAGGRATGEYVEHRAVLPCVHPTPPLTAASAAAAPMCAYGSWGFDREQIRYYGDAAGPRVVAGAPFADPDTGSDDGGDDVVAYLERYAECGSPWGGDAPEPAAPTTRLWCRPSAGISAPAIPACLAAMTQVRGMAFDPFTTTPERLLYFACARGLYALDLGVRAGVTDVAATSVPGGDVKTSPAAQPVGAPSHSVDDTGTVASGVRGGPAIRSLTLSLESAVSVCVTPSGWLLVTSSDGVLHAVDPEPVRAAVDAADAGGSDSAFGPAMDLPTAEAARPFTAQFGAACVCVRLTDGATAFRRLALWPPVPLHVPTSKTPLPLLIPTELFALAAPTDKPPHHQRQLLRAALPSLLCTPPLGAARYTAFLARDTGSAASGPALPVLPADVCGIVAGYVTARP